MKFYKNILGATIIATCLTSFVGCSETQDISNPSEIASKIHVHTKNWEEFLKIRSGCGDYSRYQGCIEFSKLILEQSEDLEEELAEINAAEEVEALFENTRTVLSELSNGHKNNRNDCSGYLNEDVANETCLDYIANIFSLNEESLFSRLEAVLNSWKEYR